jgi:hypothetical protein
MVIEPKTTKNSSKPSPAKKVELGVLKSVMWGVSGWRRGLTTVLAGLALVGTGAKLTLKVTSYCAEKAAAEKVVEVARVEAARQEMVASLKPDFVYYVGADFAKEPREISGMVVPFSKIKDPQGFLQKSPDVVDDVGTLISQDGKQFANVSFVSNAAVGNRVLVTSPWTKNAVVSSLLGVVASIGALIFGINKSISLSDRIYNFALRRKTNLGRIKREDPPAELAGVGR